MKVEDISFKDLMFFDNWVVVSFMISYLILFIKYVLVIVYNGKCIVFIISKEILQFIVLLRILSEVMEVMFVSQGGCLDVVRELWLYVILKGLLFFG